jgi:MFS family permease
MVVGVTIASLFTLMVSLGQNSTTIFLGRFLSGLFGNAPISIVGGAATDNWNAIDRGVSLGVVIGAVFSGPMLGPIIGGFVAENLNWRWNMWLMIIAGFAMALVCGLFLEESYIPRVLVKKAKRLRKETGNYKLKTELEETGIDLSRIVSVYLVRPWSKFVKPYIGIHPSTNSLFHFRAFRYRTNFSVCHYIPVIYLWDCLSFFHIYPYRI